MSWRSGSFIHPQRLTLLPTATSYTLWGSACTRHYFRFNHSSLGPREGSKHQSPLRVHSTSFADSPLPSGANAEVLHVPATADRYPLSLVTKIKQSTRSSPAGPDPMRLLSTKVKGLQPCRPRFSDVHKRPVDSIDR